MPLYFFSPVQEFLFSAEPPNSHFPVDLLRLFLPFARILLLSHSLQNPRLTLLSTLRFLPVLLPLSTVYQSHTFFLISIQIPSFLRLKTSHPPHLTTSFPLLPGRSEADRLPGSG